MATISEVSTREGLSPEQLKFLEKNFVVYDPLYRECYQDFSGLGNYQVYLIGEYHDTNLSFGFSR